MQAMTAAELAQVAGIDDGFFTEPPTANPAAVKTTPAVIFPARVDITRCFTQRPAPFNFVIPGLLVGTIGILVSPGGAGKTILAMQIAASVATGTDPLGIGIKDAGSVLFLAGEDPDIALHHRLHSLAQHYNKAEQAHIAARCDFRCTVGLGSDIMSDAWRDWIREQSKGRRLVIIDTLSRFHCLDENDSACAKQIMMRLEQIAHEMQTAILVLHHVNKSAATNGLGGEQQAARGSSVFIDNARWGSFLAGMTEKEAEGRNVEAADRRKFVRWNISKQNYSAPIEDIWFMRGEGGVLIPADFRTVEAKTKAYAQASNGGGQSDDKWF